MKEEQNSYVIIIVIGLMIVLTVGSLYLVTRSRDKINYVALANCLVDEEVKIYSSWWCTHCQQQERMFGSAYNILREGGVLVECSPPGERIWIDECLNESLRGTPTWRFKNGIEKVSLLNAEEISEYSGCALEKVI